MTGLRFVDDHQADQRITDLGQVAGVSRSSHYAWRTRDPSPRAVANAELLSRSARFTNSHAGPTGRPGYGASSDDEAGQ